MRYFGGKNKIAKQLSTYIKFRLGNRSLVEPFCGGLSVTNELRDCKNIIALDYSESLINLYNNIKNGWIPPDKLSEIDYNYLKDLKDVKNPLTAFAGYGCSFGGKYFGGYAKDNSSRNYALNAKNSLLKKMNNLKHVEFIHSNYEDIESKVKINNNSLIYCDPPYLGTTQYSATGSFNTEKFWIKCKDWAKLGAIVLVSEYKAPEFAKEVLSIKTKLDMHSEKNKRVEKLFEVVY